MRSTYDARAGLIGLGLAVVLSTSILSTDKLEDVKIENTASQTVQAVEVVPKTPDIIETKTSLGEFVITAYCPCPKCCGVWADGITYTGEIATENRTIAVDPNVIPLGSTVEINGNRYRAEDIGGVIKGKKIDLYFDSHQVALDWGVQRHEVYLVEEAY